MEYGFRIDRFIELKQSITSYNENTRNQKGGEDARFLNKNLIFLKRTTYKLSAYTSQERRTLFKKDFGLGKFDWKNNSQSKLSI